MCNPHQGPTGEALAVARCACNGPSGTGALVPPARGLTSRHARFEPPRSAATIIQWAGQFPGTVSTGIENGTLRGELEIGTRHPGAKPRGTHASLEDTAYSGL